MVKECGKKKSDEVIDERKTMRALMKPGIVGAIYVLLLSSGCSSTNQSAAMPPNLDRMNVPKANFSMTAERFRFTPDAIHVKAGTLVHIDLRSTNGTHGFKLSDFGIDESIDEGETKSIEFYAEKKGEYTFRCSHFCGIGHFGMTGHVIVE